MDSAHAATWIAPADEVDRGNLLGAAVTVAERRGLTLADIVEGPESQEAALAAARRTGLLIVPSFDQVMPVVAHAAGLMRQAQDEGWTLLLLDLGADSSAPTAATMTGFLARLSATGGPTVDAPLPDAVLRHRVGGGRGGHAFARSGLLHVECFEAALAVAGVELARTARLLEWGAGSGRMTAHLLTRAPEAQTTAADTDAEAIAWVAAQLPVHHAVTLPLRPPAALESDAFDVVIGHSVFSHLEVASQDAWLAELARVTRPGGHVAVSFNGPLALDWHLAHPLADVPDSVRDACLRDGVAVWGDDGWDDEFYAGYHTTFHRHSYIREHWAQWFDVIHIAAGAALPVQDIAVLRAR